MTSTNDLAVRPPHLLTEEEPGGVDLPAAERAAHDLLVVLGYHELVVARDIPFHSLCEHHTTSPTKELS